MAKPTNKEILEQVNKMTVKANNTELVLSLFIKFMEKEPDFRKFIIDWEEEQKKLKAQQNNSSDVSQVQKQ